MILIIAIKSSNFYDIWRFRNFLRYIYLYDYIENVWADVISIEVSFKCKKLQA